MLTTNTTRKQKISKHEIILFILNILLSAYYDTCTDFIKHKNEEIFFLGIFQFNGLFLRHVKMVLKSGFATLF